jgi:hypothetical protein
MDNNIIKKFGQRLNYSDDEMKLVEEGEHPIRHVYQLAKAAALYSIKAEAVRSRHCNLRHEAGQKNPLDVDGNFLTNQKRLSLTRSYTSQPAFQLMPLSFP